MSVPLTVITLVSPPPLLAFRKFTTAFVEDIAASPPSVRLPTNEVLSLMNDPHVMEVPETAPATTTARNSPAVSSW